MNNYIEYKEDEPKKEKYLRISVRNFLLLKYGNFFSGIIIGILIYYYFIV